MENTKTLIIKERGEQNKVRLTSWSTLVSLLVSVIAAVVGHSPNNTIFLSVA